MIDPLRSAASRWPDAPALSDGTIDHTWSELLGAAERLASCLAIAPGTRVGLLAQDRAQTVVAIHAIRLAGGVLIPLHRRLAIPELREQLDASRVAVLAHDAAYAASAATLVAGATGLSRTTDVSAPPAAGRSLSTAALDLAAPGAVVHTSGTTSAPRGVLLSHGALLASAAAWNTFLASGSDDHWLAALPLSHVAGLGMVLRPLLSGARLTIHERFDPDAVWHCIGHDGITIVSLVPTQLSRLLEAGPEVRGSLRAVLLGGAPAPVELVERAILAGVPVMTTYGLTEAGSGVTALSADEVKQAPGSAGRPLPGCRVRVTDKQGSAVPAGVRGRIEVSGPMLASGYDDDPAASRDTFVDGWLRTRDLGAIDEQGRLWVADRLDDLIITGGENVSPAEVETVLATHPALADVAVAGRPDASWGQVPVAALVTRDGLPAPSLDELRGFARAHLAGYKLPADIGVVPMIPRTASGKVIRREVVALVAAATPTEVDVSRPDGAVVHVEVRGCGPVVVLLHATLSSSAELRPLAGRLATRFRVLSVDRRSAGASRMPADDPGGPVDVAVHLADLEAVLALIAPGERVLAAGHSFGGCVALELAARRPAVVAGVWAFEPPYLSLLPPGATPDLTALGDRIADLARDAGPTAAALAFLDTIRGAGTSERLPAEARERLGAEGRGAVADAALLGFQPDGLDQVDAPAVVAIGGRGGGPYAAVASALQARVPGLVIEPLGDLGHGAPVSRPDIPAASIVTFASRIGHSAGDPTQVQAAPS